MQQHGAKSTTSQLRTTATDNASQVATFMPPRGIVSPFDDLLAFARGFLAEPSAVGSVVPSSLFLERRLVRAAELERARTVVELGPGTGGTTRALLRSLAPSATLLAIELSPTFHARLTERIPDRRLAIRLDSAENLLEILAALRLPAPDAVLSGIPFSTMTVTQGDRIAASIANCLAPGGRFVAYQVRGHVADRVSPYLGQPDVSWEWRNVPPLRVYRWVKRRDQAPTGV